MDTSRRRNMMDKPIGKGRSEVSLSAFSFLFSELVQYSQARVQSVADLERKLEVAGFGVGLRFLELLSYREKQNRRELRLLGILQVLRLLLPLVYFVVILLTYRIVFFYNIGLELLSHFRYQFIHNVVWRQLFGKTADALEKSAESDDSYMIQERDPITNRFISTPSNGLNCASFIAGIIHGVLDGAGFPSEVSAHFVSMGPGQPDKTVFLVKFDRTVLDREARLSHS